MTACSPAFWPIRMIRNPACAPICPGCTPRLGGAETLASYGVTNGRRPPGRPGPCRGAWRPSRKRTAIFWKPGRPCTDRRCALRPCRHPPRRRADRPDPKTDLVWIREAFLDDPTRSRPADRAWPYRHRHAHPLRQPRQHRQFSAAYGGPLSAIVIEGRDVFHLTATGPGAAAPAAGLGRPPRGASAKRQFQHLRSPM